MYASTDHSRLKIYTLKKYPSSKPGAQGEIKNPAQDTNSPRLFTPGETKAVAKSKVHQ